MSELYMELDDAVKRVNLLCKWEFGKDCVFDETVLRQELEQICKIPSPVEVIRCKDCKHHEDFLFGDNDKVLCWVHDVDVVVAKNGYCNYGEREDADE